MLSTLSSSSPPSIVRRRPVPDEPHCARAHLLGVAELLDALEHELAVDES